MASGFIKDLIRSFMAGIAGKTATVRSASEVEVPAAYRGTPIIDPEKCILCGRCGKVCPAGAIALRTSASEKSVRIFVGHCVFCSECAMICPVSAITMTKVWDTVVTDRLSRDTMCKREIRRRPGPKEKQASGSVARKSQEPTPPAQDSAQAPAANNESGPANE